MNRQMAVLGGAKGKHGIGALEFAPRGPNAKAQRSAKIRKGARDFPDPPGLLGGDASPYPLAQNRSVVVNRSSGGVIRRKP